MQLSDTRKINGLIPGIIYGQNERVDELNKRIYDRFKPDQTLQTYINARPTPTKCSHFPIVDLRKLSTVEVLPSLEYSVEKNFAPLESRGPVNGYFDHVTTESQLRNQYFAIQKGGGIQSAYIPSSNSELYNVRVPTTTDSRIQPYPQLFAQQTFQTHRKIHPGVGDDILFNSTRTQLRGMGR